MNMTSLTRQQLVLKLHEIGYSHISKRTLEDWQCKDLLPPFDILGGGRGQGQGRAENAWTNGDFIFRQTICVADLMAMYKKTESVYLPLWMLGYTVPFQSLRTALTQPVLAGLYDLDQAQKGDLTLEDVIFDSAFEASDKLRKTGVLFFNMPIETLDVMGNIFFNQGYEFDEFDGTPFMEGIKSAQQWTRQLLELSPALQQTYQENESLVFFDHAQFINRYLSMPAFKQALETCTEEEFRQVADDLRVIGEVGIALTTVLLSHVPPEFRMNEQNALDILFKLGYGLALADMSLRRGGFATQIEAAREQLLLSFHMELQELLHPASPFGQMLSAAITMTVEVFKDWEGLSTSQSSRTTIQTR